MIATTTAAADTSSSGGVNEGGEDGDKEEDEDEEGNDENEEEDEDEDDEEDDEEEEEARRKCFFLNLYHLMVAHAQLLFGPPDNYLQLVKFFNRSCYELGGGPNGSGGQDVLSLAELEHGVLRSPMSPPDQVHSL